MTSSCCSCSPPLFCVCDTGFLSMALAFPLHLPSQVMGLGGICDSRVWSLVGFLGLYVHITFSCQIYRSLSAETTPSLKLHVQNHDEGVLLKQLIHLQVWKEPGPRTKWSVSNKASLFAICLQCLFNRLIIGRSLNFHRRQHCQGDDIQTSSEHKQEATSHDSASLIHDSLKLSVL